jgi:C4-dicarboxylate transporter DctM subunit
MKSSASRKGYELVIAAVFALILMLLVVVFAIGKGQNASAALQLLAMSAIFAGFFVSGVYVAAGVGALGVIAGILFSARPLHLFAGQIIWNASSNFLFVAVPMFLLMGDVLLRSGLSDRLYRALTPWVSGLPGGLIHTNIVSCAIFAAVTGSSVATSATIGRVALPYFHNTEYDEKLVLGSLAAGGTLGILIPPSIAFIIYGLLTETSVGQLYAAGLVPGVLLAVMFSGYVVVRELRGRGIRKRATASYSWSVRLRALFDLLPTVALIGLVLGSIYGGFATPTEAAALGVLGALVLAGIYRRLSIRMLHDAARSTARTTSMIGLIILGAFVLNFASSAIGLPQSLASLVTALPLPSWALMLVIIGFYIALGTFMESLSMMVLTIPIVFPIVIALGFDPVWFGVVIVVLVEMALISPPDGLNMYVIQGMRQGGGPITDVFAGVLPFLGVMFLLILILMVLPGIALWLPSVLYHSS